MEVSAILVLTKNTQLAIIILDKIVNLHNKSF